MPYSPFVTVFQIILSAPMLTSCFLLSLCKEGLIAAIVLFQHLISTSPSRSLLPPTLATSSLHLLLLLLSGPPSPPSCLGLGRSPCPVPRDDAEAAANKQPVERHRGGAGAQVRVGQPACLPACLSVSHIPSWNLVSGF